MTTKPKLYVSYQQQCMYSAWETNGYCGLAQEVEEMEKHHSANISHSRITDQTQYMPHALLLLSQLPQGDGSGPGEDLIESLLHNRLIEDIKSGTLKLPQRFKIDVSPQLPGKVACGIYANYLLDPRGHGLSVTEYEEFVEGMIACIENRLMRSHRQGFDIDQAATAYFHNYTRRLVSEIPEMRKSCAKGTNLLTFKKTQADLIAAAKADNADEIRLAGEAGFSINVHTRCYEHDELQGSANFFRLARCVLNALWPTRKFILHSVYLFQAFSVEHVEFGEGVATHLVGGYPDYGGFNYTQAGMQIQSAKVFGHTNWRRMAKENSGTRTLMGENIQNSIDEWANKIQSLEDTQARAKKQSDLDALIQQVSDQLARIKEDDDDTKTQSEFVKNEIDHLKKYINRKEQETEKMISSVTKFLRAVGAVKKTPQFTQVAQSSSAEESGDSKEEEAQQTADPEDLMEVVEEAAESEDPEDEAGQAAEPEDSEMVDVWRNVF